MEPDQQINNNLDEYPSINEYEDLVKVIIDKYLEENWKAKGFVQKIEQSNGYQNFIDDPIKISSKYQNSYSSYKYPINARVAKKVSEFVYNYLSE